MGQLVVVVRPLSCVVMCMQGEGKEAGGKGEHAGAPNRHHSMVTDATHLGMWGSDGVLPRRVLAKARGTERLTVLTASLSSRSLIDFGFLPATSRSASDPSPFSSSSVCACLS